MNNRERRRKVYVRILPLLDKVVEGDSSISEAFSAWSKDKVESMYGEKYSAPPQVSEGDCSTYRWPVHTCLKLTTKGRPYIVLTVDGQAPYFITS